MKKTFKVLCISFFMACMVFSSFARGQKEESLAKPVTLRIFNAKGENAVEFEKMCADYENQTGVKVEAFSVGSGTSAIDLLRAQMSSKTAPAIYSIRGLTELPEWKESGSVLDFSAVSNPTFQKFANEIPLSMRLSSDGKESFGVPFNVEGYGYMVDSQMLKDLFGNDGNAVLDALRYCSYDEFVSFVKIIDAYIAKPSAQKISLGGKAYTLAASKTGRAEKLTGVFAFAGSEKWTYGDHSVNIFLNMVLESAGAAAKVSEAQISQLRDPLFAYMKNLDLVTSHVGGLKGKGQRGPDLINSANFGYDQSVQAYVDGNVLFLQQGNWIAVNIEAIDPAVATRSSFIPVKMPVTDAMVKTGMTAKQFNEAIPIYVPNYYVINAKVSKAEQDAAVDFLLWMNSKENVQKYIVGDFKAIPYNADSSFTITDSLSKSIISYLDKGAFISNPYMGMPKPWYRDDIAGNVMEKFLNKKDWADKDIEAFVDNALAGLKAKLQK